jgi:hypothetical protein
LPPPLAAKFFGDFCDALALDMANDGFLIRITPRFALRRLMDYLNIQGSENELGLLRRERGND